MSDAVPDRTSGMTHEGGCTCGGVRYRMLADPIVTHACHCRQCQRHTGGAFVLNAIVETEGLELLCGDPRAIRFAGTTHTAWFCADCGTYVWSAYEGRFRGCRFVRVGTLDDPDACPPDVQIYTASAQPWVPLSDSIQTYPDGYELEQVLSARSLERLQAANARADRAV